MTTLLLSLSLFVSSQFHIFLSLEKSVSDEKLSWCLVCTVASVGEVETAGRLYHHVLYNYGADSFQGSSDVILSPSIVHACFR